MPSLLTTSMEIVRSLARAKPLGERGEIAAAQYLKRHGHRILMFNYRIRGGEIDIVAREGDVLVFVEVKTRSDENAAAPHRQVTHTKQVRLTRAARAYLSHYDRMPQCRFDVVSIVWTDGGRPQIEHIRNAFEAAF